MNTTRLIIDIPPIVLFLVGTICADDKAAPATMLGFFIGITIGHLALPKHTENEHEEKTQD